MANASTFYNSYIGLLNCLIERCLPPKDIYQFLQKLLDTKPLLGSKYLHTEIVRFFQKEISVDTSICFHIYVEGIKEIDMALEKELFSLNNTDCANLINTINDIFYKYIENIRDKLKKEKTNRIKSQKRTVFYQDSLTINFNQNIRLNDLKFICKELRTLREFLFKASYSTKEKLAFDLRKQTYSFLDKRAENVIYLNFTSNIKDELKTLLFILQRAQHALKGITNTNLIIEDLIIGANFQDFVLEGQYVAFLIEKIDNIISNLRSNQITGFDSPNRNSENSQ